MKPYSCHNRAPFEKEKVVQDGWIEQPLSVDAVTRIPRMVEIPVRGTPECQYTHTALGQADAGCIGCKHRAEVA